MWTELRTVGIPVLFLIFVGEFLIFHHKILFWLWDFYRCLCLLLEPIVTANFVALYKVWQWNWIHCKKPDSETCILWPSPAQYKRRNAHIDWKNEGRLHGGGGICLVVCWWMKKILSGENGLGQPTEGEAWAKIWEGSSSRRFGGLYRNKVCVKKE